MFLKVRYSLEVAAAAVWMSKTSQEKRDRKENIRNGFEFEMPFGGGYFTGPYPSVEQEAMPWAPTGLHRHGSQTVG